MEEIEEKVLKVLDKPLRNDEIWKLTGLGKNNVNRALKNLRATGHIVSRGKGPAREHMRLATAIDKNHKWAWDWVDELDRRLRELERRQDQR